VASTLLAMPAAAWKLSPSGTEQEKKVSALTAGRWDRAWQILTASGIYHFTESVHEEITQKIYGCEGDGEACASGDMLYASPYVIAGVRWNDDPPFRLDSGEGTRTDCRTSETIRVTTQPRCWVQLFRDAERRAKSGRPLHAGSGASLLARSHFGDLQFIHAMAERDGEIAYETRRRIMMWAEFTWRTSLGEYKLDRQLRELPIAGMPEFFGHSEWRVQDLFTLGNPPLRRYVHEVAFGSLLHMIQDSFAKGHAEREEAVSGATCPDTDQLPMPGRVREFHSYVGQDSSRHGHYDSADAFKAHMLAERPSVVDVGRALRELNDARAPWEQARPYLECIFALADPQRPAAAGADFRDR
jgi:hypothetical protein